MIHYLVYYKGGHVKSVWSGAAQNDIPVLYPTLESARRALHGREGWVTSVEVTARENFPCDE
jgi:hypothetical protein